MNRQAERWGSKMDLPVGLVVNDGRAKYLTWMLHHYSFNNCNKRILRDENQYLAHFLQYH